MPYGKNKEPEPPKEKKNNKAKPKPEAPPKHRSKPQSGKAKREKILAKRKNKVSGLDKFSGDVDALFDKLEDQKDLELHGVQKDRATGLYNKVDQSAIPQLHTNTGIQVSNEVIYDETHVIKNSADKFFLKLKKMTKDQVAGNVSLAQSVKLDVRASPDHFDFHKNNISWPDFPKRPDCDVFKLRKQTLLNLEEEGFRKFEEKIRNSENVDRLNRFEYNLETWRQLWRVLEKSNVIALVSDSRFPDLTCPESLLEYCAELNLPVMLILNKIDLVPKETAAKLYEHYSNHKLIQSVILFSCSQRDKNMNMKKFRELEYNCKLGPADLLEALPVEDVDDWDEVLGEARVCLHDKTKFKKIDMTDFKNKLNDPSLPLGFEDEEHLTLGILGSPNVGKSSVMNRLVGKKITRTSITPGATKYFQTYNVSKKVTLCDCPGLVFPAYGISYAQQVMCGAFPISQVQEPYTIVGQLALNSNIIQCLKLDRNQTLKNNEDEYEPISLENVTSWRICEKYSEVCGYYAGKGGARLDVYRGANEILRRVLRGEFEVYTGLEGNFDESLLKHLELLENIRDDIGAEGEY